MEAYKYLGHTKHDFPVCCHEYQHQILSLPMYPELTKEMMDYVANSIKEFLLQMILSIICPTYNEEKYIAQTLESFLNQKYHSFNLEILICDGRSTDKTRNIVAQYSAKSSKHSVG